MANTQRKRFRASILVALLASGLGFSRPGTAQEGSTTTDTLPTTTTVSKAGVGKRYVVIGIRDALLSRHGTVVLKRGIDFAVRQKADLVVIHLDTPGGLVSVMLGMRDAIVECPIDTAAYVHPKAYSAGALLAIACDRIYMSPIALMGDAIPIQMQMGQAKELEGDLKEKILAPVKKEFGTTARVKGHPVDLAEAMVDIEMDLPEWGAPNGKILILDTPSAVKSGMAVAEVQGIEGLVALEGLAGAERIDYKTTVADKLASFLSTGVASIILIAIVIGGVVIEVKTPGFGVGGIIAISAVFLFFWANWYANLAHWLEILLFLGGIGLIVIEGVIPGFGIFGISGILCVVASIFLAMFRFPPHGFDFDYSRISDAVYNLAWALVIGMVGMVVIVKSIHGSRVWQRLSLGDEMEAKKGFTSFDDLSEFIGQRGVLVTDLRPVGTMKLGDRRFDAMTEGDFLDRGSTVKVVRVEGAQLVVEETDESL